MPSQQNVLIEKSYCQNNSESCLENKIIVTLFWVFGLNGISKNDVKFGAMYSDNITNLDMYTNIVELALKIMCKIKVTQ